MIFNVIAGKPNVAIITVTAPANTTVTCTLSPYSITKSTGSGTTVSFSVPKTGTWTITAVQGGITQTASISVTDHSAKSVSFVFEQWIFAENSGVADNYNLHTERYQSAAGWGADARSVASVTTARIYVSGDSWAVSESESGTLRGSVTTKASYNLSGYNKLIIEGEALSKGLSISCGSATLKFTGSSRHTQEFDISSVTGNAQISFYGTEYGNGGTIYNARLTA